MTMLKNATFAGVALALALTAPSGASASGLDSVIKRFSGPRDVLIVNGEVRLFTRVCEEGDASGTKECLYIFYKKDGTRLSGYESEIYDSLNRIVRFKDSAQEGSWTYYEDYTGIVQRVTLEVTPPKTQWLTPMWRWCYEGSEDCYGVVAMTHDYAIIRDRSNMVTEVHIQSTYFFNQRPAVSAFQRGIVSYPAPYILRIDYQNYGEPWADLNKWEKYRIEDGKKIVEVCRGECEK
jgi:hypothetical protein